MLSAILPNLVFVSTILISRSSIRASPHRHKSLCKNNPKTAGVPILRAGTVHHNIIISLKIYLVTYLFYSG